MTADFENLNKKFRERPPAFLIFSDLDGTFTPMDIMGKIDFINIVKEIRDKEKCVVKFVPVSGRPAGYVLRVLHDCRDMLKAEGIMDACDFGAAESGALITNCHRTYDLTYLGKPESKQYKSVIADVIDKSKYKRFVSDEIDKLFTCSIHIIDEIKQRIPHAKQYEIYNSIKDDIEARLGKNKLNFAMSHNTMEVMPAEIKKSEGIRWAMDHYKKEFNIIGLLYAGDAENDKLAMDYVSRLAEIPGIHAHNYTPGNSQDAISSWAVEPWKHKNPAAHAHYVQKGIQLRFRGITELVRLEMLRNRLTGTGIRFWGTMDDCHPLHLSSVRNPQFTTVVRRRFNTPSPPIVEKVKRKKSKSVHFK